MLLRSGLQVRLCMIHSIREAVSGSNAGPRCFSSLSSLQEQKAPNDKFLKIDKLDVFLEDVSRLLSRQRLISIPQLYKQYHDEAYNVIDRMVPYEERPRPSKRADTSHDDSHDLGATEGDGLVLVVHAQLDPSSTRLDLDKTTVCSGFVVDASVNEQGQGDTIVTCAHTLEKIFRDLKKESDPKAESPETFSFIIPKNGPPRPITRLLSSIPRADEIVVESLLSGTGRRLRPLPLTPFPIDTKTRTLTHLFGSPDPPAVIHSVARTECKLPEMDATAIEQPVSWISGSAWRRWGRGQMLGYRSYTGLDIEAGVSSILPHILTSILPQGGSSGGPIVNAETGCVVGMTSGRRMDNRAEGERGWGCSSEMIFMMFSLPGFTPTKR